MLKNRLRLYPILFFWEPLFRNSRPARETLDKCELQWGSGGGKFSLYPTPISRLPPSDCSLNNSFVNGLVGLVVNLFYSFVFSKNFRFCLIYNFQVIGFFKLPTIDISALVFN